MSEQYMNGVEREERRCHICGRAMVTGTQLPLDICRRARCQPEREYLNLQFAQMLNDFDWLAETAEVADSGVNRA